MKDTGSICDQKFVWSDNPGQNIWNKIEKSSKIGQEKKSLISTFEGFLTAIAKVKFLEERLDTRLRTYLNLKFFWYFLISLNPQILRCSATCIQLFFILDTKFRFTCDKSVLVLKQYKVLKYYDQDCSIWTGIKNFLSATSVKLLI